jgi:hypothetical protein
VWVVVNTSIAPGNNAQPASAERRLIAMLGTVWFAT